MYEYSPISKLYIRNFRNLGDVEISFEESPIVTLVGENEAGKTSVIKAFATCALHANPREQKEYIRDNTNMFGVAIDLKDGTRVTRIKETSMNSYSVKRADGSEWSASKITDGLPVEVQKVMGLIEEPETGEYLHIRTYEDKMLFVVTPASTNYKVMYTALKVEQLTKAIRLGSNEVNQIKSAISNNDNSIQALSSQMRDIQVFDIDSLISVRDRLNEQLNILDKIERARNLSQKIDNAERQLGALKLLDSFQLDTISELDASKLISINRLLNRISELNKLCNMISEVNSIEMIDIDLVNRLVNLRNKSTMLCNKINETSVLRLVNSISEISEVSAVQLNKCKAVIDKYKELENQRKTLNVNDCRIIEQSEIEAINRIDKVINGINSIRIKQNELSQLNDNISALQTKLIESGVAVETCPKCGESVIFDMNNLQG